MIEIKDLRIGNYIVARDASGELMNAVVNSIGVNIVEVITKNGSLLCSKGDIRPMIFTPIIAIFNMEFLQVESEKYFKGFEYLYDLKSADPFNEAYESDFKISASAGFFFDENKVLVATLNNNGEHLTEGVESVHEVQNLIYAIKGKDPVTTKIDLNER